MSTMQVCHCGWSKVTTYHGLRTHQGIKGCTPRGQWIPQPEQHVHNFTYMGPRIKVEPPSFVETFITPDFVPLAQTPSFMLENELHRRRTPLTELPPAAEHKGLAVTPIKKKEISSANQAAVLEIIKALVETQTRSDVDNSEFSFTADPETSPADKTGTDVDWSAFQTPERIHRTSNKTCRALEFPGFEKQVEYFTETPTFHDQVAWLRPNVKKDKDKNRHKTKHASLNVEILKTIQVREQKLSEIKLSARACKGRLDDELMEINHVFSEVMKAVQDARRKAVEPLEERRQRVKDEAGAMIGELQGEIQRLQRTIEELNKHPTLQISPQRASDRNWDEVQLETSVSLGSLRATTSSMMSQIQRSLEGLCALELKRIPAFTVDVKLDRDSAHRRLVISDDLKSVSDGGEERQLPHVAQRFDAFASVLGLNVITGGKAYWQVDVGDKSGWDLGVARRDATRKGKLRLDPDNGYWITVRYEGSKYAAMSCPPLRLWPGADPGSVGVFVDYEEGVVSFYDVTNQSHIHSFTECSFGGHVIPYFSPHLKHKNNATPLIISAVALEAKR